MNVKFLLILSSCLFLLNGCQHPQPRQPSTREEFRGVIDILNAERDPLTGRLINPRQNPSISNGGGLLPSPPKGTASNVYRLIEGDQIIIQLQGIPNEQRLDDFVDENGNITLPLLDRLYVVGKTAAEVEQIVQRAYQDQKIYKHITVNVVIPPKSYYIRGEVKVPGRYPIVNAVTLNQAIPTAGGYTEFANKKKVQLTREGKIIKVNMESVDLDPKKDYTLEAGDIIFVPKGFFSPVNLYFVRL